MEINKENNKILEDLKNKKMVNDKIIENTKTIIKNVISTYQNPEISLQYKAILLQWTSIRHNWVEIDVYDPYITVLAVSRAVTIKYVLNINALDDAKYDRINNLLKVIEDDKEINKRINDASAFFIKQNKEAYDKLSDM